MNEEDSGVFDARKFRSKGLGIILSWGAILAAGSGLVAWGATQTRLTNVERQAQQTATDQRDTERKAAISDTQVAVMRSQLETIIIQLRAIDDKLERAEKRQQ